MVAGIIKSAFEQGSIKANILPDGTVEVPHDFKISEEPDEVHIPRKSTLYASRFNAIGMNVFEIVVCPVAGPPPLAATH